MSNCKPNAASGRSVTKLRTKDFSSYDAVESEAGCCYGCKLGSRGKAEG